jgi:hypothetical protein
MQQRIEVFRLQELQLTSLRAPHLVIIASNFVG